MRPPTRYAATLRSRQSRGSWAADSLPSAGSHRWVHNRPDERCRNHFSYDATSTTLLQQRTASGATTDLVRDPDGELLAATTASGDSLRMFQNIHGDRSGVRDATSGSTLYTAVYDAFGDADTTGSLPVSLGFQSMFTDPVTGLVDMGARNYDTSTGAFTTADDVVGDLTRPITLNRYTYANAAPLDYFDPDGHWSLPTWDDITDAVGDAIDWVGKQVSDAADAISNGYQAATKAVSETASWVRSRAEATLDSAKSATRSAANVVQHQPAQILTDVEQTALDLVHNPKKALNLVISVAAGAATFVGCEAATAGAGSVACATAAFTVGGAVGGMLDCPDGQAILSCAGTGAAAGLASGLAFTAAGRLGSIAASGISAAAGGATGQYLTTGRIDGSQTAAAGILGAALGAPRVNAAMGRAASGLRTAASRVGTALYNRHQQLLARGADRSSVSPSNSPTGNAYSVAFETQAGCVRFGPKPERAFQPCERGAR